MRIGVFDSGVGGQSIANAIQKKYPDFEILVREDRQNLPYGNKSKQQLIKFVKPILQDMVIQGCEIIVVACNTVTTNIINELRGEVHIPLIGIEPMVKPAVAITKSKTIAVCATPATLHSRRYKWLKTEFAEDVIVLEPDCSTWASMVEDDQVSEDLIKAVVDESKEHGADVIVLGCTHYHWIYELINKLSGDGITVLQPTDAVLKQLKRVAEQSD